MPKGSSRRESAALVADAVGRLMEFWGFKRTMGRIWATLYVAPEPLPAAQLCERLGISAGAASMTLAELERWGVIRRLFKPGERREFFEAETDLWKMISRVYEERERREVERLSDTLQRALDTLEGASPEDTEARFAAERTRRLLEVSQLGQGLLRLLLEGGPLDLTTLQHADLKTPQETSDGGTPSEPTTH